MIRKIKNNAILLAIVAALLVIGAKNTVSAYQVATVPATRTEIWYISGGSSTTYTWQELRYNKGFVSWTTRKKFYYGIHPGHVFTYHYSTY